MKECGTTPLVVERSIAMCLYYTGEPDLIEQATVLYEQYPTLGFRPFKGAGYVHHREIYFDPITARGSSYQTVARLLKRPVPVAEAKRSLSDSVLHTITMGLDGTLVCTCQDYLYNLKPIPVLSGPNQKLCCHIFAAALSVDTLMELLILPNPELQTPRYPLRHT